MNISSLPDLRYLDFSPSYACPQHLPASSSPALRELILGRMENGSDTTLMSFIEACSSWQLESIEIACSPKLGIFEALRDHCSNSALKHLNLYRTFGISDPDNVPITMEDIDDWKVLCGTVRALFCFANLSHLSLDSFIGTDLDNAMLWEMAQSWQRLESLVLIVEQYFPRFLPSRLTIDGLQAFAQHCPRLHNLEITIDASNVPEMAPDVVPQRQLTTIDFWHSRIVSPSIVANFLSCIFPNLQTVKCEWSDWWYASALEEDSNYRDESQEFGWYVGWKEVEGLVRERARG
ncbi:hypothetical protein DFH09DRAFT_1325418 [Mycena vulgaris]|nr:hypothetical protein DFH09DRAFT_1325418 [Mycena vulgaris]